MTMMTYDELTKKHKRAFNKWKKTHDGQSFDTPDVCKQYWDHPITVAKSLENDEQVLERMLNS